MISNYYVVSYNSEGRCNLLDSNIKDLKNIIVIECCSRLVSTMILKKIANEILNKTQSIEMIHDPIDNNVIVGVICRKIGIGVFSKCIIDKDISITETLNLNYCYSSESDKIEELQNNVQKCLDEAVEHFKEAKKIHDDWEHVYTENIDFSMANEIIDNVTNEILQDTKFDKESTVHERFFGAISAEGATNYVEEIIKDKKIRYFIKGRPGTSKSTLLRRLAKSATERGIDVDIYLCASDINSLDMIVLPELDVCIFDSTSPHEFFPTEENDIVIDLYSALLEDNFDENNETLLEEIKIKYSDSVSKGVSVLKEVFKLYDNLETEYISTIDFDLLASLYDKVLKIINE